MCHKKILYLRLKKLLRSNLNEIDVDSPKKDHKEIIQKQ